MSASPAPPEFDGQPFAPLTVDQARRLGELTAGLTRPDGVSNLSPNVVLAIQDHQLALKAALPELGEEDADLVRRYLCHLGEVVLVGAAGGFQMKQNLDRLSTVFAARPFG